MRVVKMMSRMQVVKLHEVNVPRRYREEARGMLFYGNVYPGMTHRETMKVVFGVTMPMRKDIRPHIVKET